MLTLLYPGTLRIQGIGLFLLFLDTFRIKVILSFLVGFDDDDDMVLETHFHNDHFKNDHWFDESEGGYEDADNTYDDDFAARSKGGREKAGRGNGLRLPSIIPTIQPQSVFLAKGNFIPKDFSENG